MARIQTYGVLMLDGLDLIASRALHRAAPTAVLCRVCRTSITWRCAAQDPLLVAQEVLATVAFAPIRSSSSSSFSRENLPPLLLTQGFEDSPLDEIQDAPEGCVHVHGDHSFCPLILFCFFAELQGVVALNIVALLEEFRTLTLLCRVLNSLKDSTKTRPRF